ncbi:PH domain-containing protein, partial [Corynebacterium sp.]
MIAFAVANQWQLAVAVVTQLYDWAWLGLLVGTGAVAIIIGLIAFFSWLSWRYTFYELTDDEVRYGSGWLLRSRRAARLDRVQAVDINQPLLARIFGLAEIVIETAGGSDSHFTIKYLTPPQCEQFRADVLGEVEKLDTELAHSLYDGDSPAAAQDSSAHMSSRMSDAKTIFGPV